jgi:hypothetical protein
MTYFTTTGEGKGILNEYEIKNENKMLRFEKQLVNPQTKLEKSSISL